MPGEAGQPPEEPPVPPNANDEGEGEEKGPESPKPPDSPFTTETIEFAVADEALAVLLRGGPVATESIGLGVAGPFLNRLHELLFALTSFFVGRDPGRRGPLPHLQQAGALSLVQVQFGASATFHFAVEGDEQLQMTDAGEATSAIADAIRVVGDLFAYGAADDEEQLFALTREFTPRIGSDYAQLLDVLVRHEVDTVWRMRDRKMVIELPRRQAARTRATLDRQAEPVIQVREYEGLLFRADSIEHGFQLAPEDVEEGRVSGTYPEELRELIRTAWGRRVRIKVEVRRQRLERQREPGVPVVTLIDILEILE
jgi:hypothetical protein